MLDKTCELCPDYAGCRQFIDDNVDQLYELLRKEVTADNICQALRLCGTRVAVPEKPKDNPACEECQKIAKVIVDAINVSSDPRFARSTLDSNLKS